jgi:hypothetical protein
MQLQGPVSDIVFSSARQETRTRHGFTVPRSLPSRLGRSVAALARSAWSSSAARCFSTFSSRDARLFTSEFVRGSLLVRCASALRRDRALCLRVHRCKSTRSLANITGAPRFSTTVIAPAHAATSTSTSGSAASASLVHPLLLVVPLVCHYRSPAAIFELNDAAAGRTPRDGGLVGARRSSAGYFNAQASGRSFGGRVKTRLTASLWISSLLTCL